MEECKRELLCLSVDRWPKLLVGNLGEPRGHMLLNLVIKGRRR